MKLEMIADKPAKCFLACMGKEMEFVSIKLEGMIFHKFKKKMYYR